MSQAGSPQSDRGLLRALAIRAMRERGLDPDFSQEELAEAAAVRAAPTTASDPVRDLRTLLWCSIDNDDSRDLDQLSVADAARRRRRESAGRDRRRRRRRCRRSRRSIGMPRVNTTSVYTPAAIFPMLPERFSTDLTSLDDGRGPARGRDRVRRGRRTATSRASDVYRARVRNHAKLAYNGVGAWLTGHGPLPPAAAAVRGHRRAAAVAGRRGAGARRARRHEHGRARVRDDRGAAGVRRRHARAICSRRRRTARRR